MAFIALNSILIASTVHGAEGAPIGGGGAPLHRGELPLRGAEVPADLGDEFRLLPAVFNSKFNRQRAVGRLLRGLIAELRRARGEQPLKRVSLAAHRAHIISVVYLEEDVSEVGESRVAWSAGS